MFVLTDQLLESYYKLLMNNFHTGMDRISPDVFQNNKEENFSIIKRKILNGTYNFTQLKKITLLTERDVFIPTIRDKIVIEYLKDILKKKYQINYLNREKIIKSIISKLKSNMPFYIIRLDIKNFFSSIPQQKLLQKLKKSSLLSFEEYTLLKNIIKLSGNKGIPQGLSISNILSEIYLENLDRTLKRIHPSLNFYCRYVDDIFILINGTLLQSEEKIIKDTIGKVFKENGLKINEEKEDYIRFSLENQNQKPFEYLGYKFEVENRKLSLSIGKNKLNKVKLHIDLIFNDFENNHNEELLYERLKYLTSKKRTVKSSFSLTKKSTIKTFKKQFFFGPIEAYKEVGPNHSNWGELDRYIKGKIMLFKNNNLLNRNDILRKLYSCSFVRFYQNNEIYKIDKLTTDDLANILYRINQGEIPLMYYRRLSRQRLIQLFFKNVDI